MTKETISTFLPIVNILSGILAKPVKSKVANSEIKLLKSVFFSYSPWIPCHVIDSLQSCISITWDVWPLVPFLVRCVVSTVYAHRIFVELDRCSKIFFFIRFWTMEKGSQRRREIIIDVRSIYQSWQCFQLAFLVTWKVTFSAQSEQVSTNVPFF